MSFWTSSSILLRETVFEGYIRNIEPLCIGSGKEPPLGSLADRVVLRIDYRGRSIPYIPGSSLKGVFRSSATMLARSIGLKACSGLSKDVCTEIEKVVKGTSEMKLGDLIEYYIRVGETKTAMEKFYENACLICKIFGSPYYSSKVYFSDAYPIGADGEILPFSLNTRTGIAIDRRTGAVHGGALYTVEFVEPDARFKFMLHAKNLPNYALGLLSTIIIMINHGEVKIGGFKTRGFGAVKIENLIFKSRDHPRTEGLKLTSLDREKDREVDLSGVARLEDNWLIAEEENAWEVLRKLEGIWYEFGKSSSCKKST
ncbi:MAG: CRISPR-associated RAMP protein Csx7 [Aigarchaeota archaeon]|nr:CRISPR-associated RAMP protein Csx7 [Candidatus Geocrenenecus dongiae]